MKTPIEMMLDGVDWVEQSPPDEDSCLPYATHNGVFSFAGHEIRCYRLSDGRAVFHAEDFTQFLNQWLGDGAAS